MFRIHLNSMFALPKGFSCILMKRRNNETGDFRVLNPPDIINTMVPL